MTTPPAAADFSFSRPTADALVRSGYVCAIGYMSYDPLKNLTKAEIQSFLAAGLDVLLVWETSGQAASQGKAAGEREGADCLAQMHTVGYTGTPYFVLEDPHPVPARSWPAVEAYARAAANAVGRPIGGYGSQVLLEEMMGRGAIHYGWQVGGWSISVSPHCHLYQRVTPTLPDPGASIDEDAVLQPDFGQMRAPAPTTGAPMPLGSSPTDDRASAIMLIYKVFLGRLPTQAELNIEVPRMTNPGWQQVINDINNTDEARRLTQARGW